MRTPFRLSTTLLIAALCTLPACGDDDAPAPDAGATDLGASDLGADLGDDLGTDLGTDLGSDLGNCIDEDGDGVPAASCGGSDCDDTDSGRYPGNLEVCDGDDEDCDEATLGPDADGDGDVYFACCDATGRCGSDCDDTRRAINATAIESCNGFDDDCDGQTDEGVTAVACMDMDGDARGPVDVSTVGCFVPIGASTICNDCAEGDPSRYVGAFEACNEIDDDCDGAVDEGCTCATGTVRTCGRDAGACRAGTQSCLGGVWESACAGGVFPTVELCDRADNDCDGDVDEGVTYPYYPDCDRDGYGRTAEEARSCERPVGVPPACRTGVWAMVGGDCNDADDTVYPGAGSCTTCMPRPVVVPSDMPCATPGPGGGTSLICGECRTTALRECAIEMQPACRSAYEALDCCEQACTTGTRCCEAQAAAVESVCNDRMLLGLCFPAEAACGTPPAPDAGAPDAGEADLDAGTGPDMPMCSPRYGTASFGNCADASDMSTRCTTCKTNAYIECAIAESTNCADAVRAYECCSGPCDAELAQVNSSGGCGSGPIAAACNTLALDRCLTPP